MALPNFNPKILLRFSRLIRRKEIYIKKNRSLTTCSILRLQEVTNKFIDFKKSTFLTQSLENLFFHNILEKREGCSATNVSNFKDKLSRSESELNVERLLAEVNLKKSTPHELCSLFETISIDAANRTFLPFSNGIFSKLSEAIVDNLKNFSDDQLGSILLYTSIWPPSESTKAANFLPLWRSLDFECIERWRDWSNDKMLHFIDLWYLLKMARISDFCFYSLTHLGKKCHRLTDPQLLQLLFYYNVVRTISKSVTVYNIENRLEECVKRLTLDEIGLASLAFFKTQNLLRGPELMKYIMNKTINEAETVEYITLASILKCLRLSLPIPLWIEIPRLLDALTPQLDRLPLQCGIHLTYLTSPSRVLHPPSLNSIAHRLIGQLPTARLKDIEKVILSLSQLNYQPETPTCVYTEVINELRKPDRLSEINLFPRSFVAVVHFLCLQSHLPHDLISMILDMDFITKTYGKKKFLFGRELLTIDTILEIESSGYSGNRLPEDIRNYLFKRYSQFLPNPEANMSKHAAFTEKLKNMAEYILGKGCVKYVYILPSAPKADIVYQTDQFGRAVPLPEDFLSIEDFSGIVKAPKNSNQWHAIIPATRNMFLFNSTEPSGETASKLRCLSLLGYQPHLLPMNTWPQQDAEGENLLKEKLFC